MAATTATEAAPAVPRVETSNAGKGRSSRSTAYAGITFAVLFVAGMMTMGSTPDNAASNEEWLDYFDERGHRMLALGAAWLLVIAAMAFVVFAAGLATWLRVRLPTDSSLPTVLVAGSVLFAGALAVGAMTVASFAGAVDFGEVEGLGGDSAKLVEQIGYGMILVVGGMSAALTIGAATIAGRRSGTASRWLVGLGWFCALVVGVGGVIYVPMIFVAVWTVAVATTMLRRGADVSTG